MSNTAPNQKNKPRTVLALTPGEPAGIGPDLAISLAAPHDHDLVIIADPALLHARAQQLGRTFNAPSWPGGGGNSAGTYVLAQTCAATPETGKLDPANSRYVLNCLKRAAQGCQSGEFDALVTGPVHKGIINDAGLAFTGHTEFLAAESATQQVVMMLASPDLRVALATTHLPLRDVSAAITREHLEGVLRILRTDLVKKFGMTNPRIRVCGLNPHAGESGHLGREEIEVIEPVLNNLRAEGMQLEGPVPADTAFLPPSLALTDAILAMYHDQGLPVLKHNDFAHAINITLGLPFVRTSVDHGTALELAGTGRANITSLEAALAFARQLCR